MGEKQDQPSQLSFNRCLSRLRGIFGAIDGRLGQTWEKNCLIAQTTLALVIVVIGIKLGKLMFASMGDVGPHPIRTALSVTYASVLVRIAVVVAGGFLVGKLLCPRWKMASRHVAIRWLSPLQDGPSSVDNEAGSFILARPG